MGGVAFAAALTSAQPSRAVPPAQATALSRLSLWPAVCPQAFVQEL